MHHPPMPSADEPTSACADVRVSPTSRNDSGPHRRRLGVEYGTIACGRSHPWTEVSSAEWAQRRLAGADGSAARSGHLRRASFRTVQLQPPLVSRWNRKKWKTRVELANAIFQYIGTFHNRRRRHSALGYRTPTEYELLFEINTSPAVS